MNPMLIAVFLLWLAQPLWAGPDRALQSQASLLYAPHEAQVDQNVSFELRIAAAYCQVHTFTSKQQKLCWKRMKEALLKTAAVSSYPQTPYAFQAGDELVSKYGFHRISVSNPYDAPVGAILVYKDNGEAGGFGHTEFRTLHGFASDYSSPNYCKFRLTGVYIK